LSVDSRDIALEDLASDVLRLEHELLDALAEAATYRQMLLLALVGWQATKKQLHLSEKQVQHLMGVEDESL
jgi:hypothetical protein